MPRRSARLATKAEEAILLSTESSKALTEASVLASETMVTKTNILSARSTDKMADHPRLLAQNRVGLKSYDSHRQSGVGYLQPANQPNRKEQVEGPVKRRGALRSTYGLS